MLQWQFFEQYQHRAVDRGRPVPGRLLRRGREARGPIEQQTANGYVALDAMERHLDGRTFLVGEATPLADISLYAYTHVAHEGGFDLEQYPAIRAGSTASPASPGHIAIDA